MSKRIQFLITDEAWNILEATTRQACQDFNVGTITYADVLNEMILDAQINIDVLRFKRTDLKKSLRVLASSENVDIDSVLKTLLELKERKGQRDTTTGKSADLGGDA